MRHITFQQLFTHIRSLLAIFIVRNECYVFKWEWFLKTKKEHLLRCLKRS